MHELKKCIEDLQRESVEDVRRQDKDNMQLDNMILSKGQEVEEQHEGEEHGEFQEDYGCLDWVDKGGKKGGAKGGYKGNVKGKSACWTCNGEGHRLTTKKY